MNYKGIIAFLLITIMVLSAFPIMDLIEVEGKDGSFGGGSGTVSDPYIIEDVWDLQEMNESLSAHYILGNDIDASETETWNDGAGFIPIGEKYYNLLDGWIEHPFTGSFDGNGHTISGIYIYRIENSFIGLSSIGLSSIGLFGYMGSEGSVMDLEVVGSDINGNYSVGGLAGSNEGLISNCFFQGSVSGLNFVGGLVGTNDQGTVINCHTDVNLDESSEMHLLVIGGLIGTNNGKVEDCSSTGIITGTFVTGGLIGKNVGNFIINSHSTCDVTSSSGLCCGGLIGENIAGNISDCYSTGSVYGEDWVGGLIGSNTGNVSNCHSIGNVRGMAGEVGGLLGRSEGVIANCYSTGSVYGGSSVGGLIGVHILGNVSNCHSIGDVNGMGNGVGGLLGYSGDVVANCYSTGSVYGANGVGGFVGQHGGYFSQSGDTIIECFSSGNVSGEGVGVGGFAGTNSRPVENCFSLSDVIGSSEVGGFIGANNGGTASNCYSIGDVSGTETDIGGFVGANNSESEYEGSFEHCYWNVDTSGQTESKGGEGKTTVEMKSRATYVSWDFDNIWGIIDGEDYPYLQALLSAQGARILSPKHIGTLVEGDSLRFIGSSSPDPNVGYLWAFTDGRTSSSKTPGIIPFSSAGPREVSYSFTLNDKEYLEKDTISFEVVDDPQSYPDLTVMGYNIPERMSIGDPVSVIYYVVNNENIPITGKIWKDSIYLSNDQYLDALDTKLASEIMSMDIPENGGYQGCFNFTPPAVKEGPYYLIISVNDEWSFVEVHRLNNERERTIDIAIPELHEGVEYESAYSSGTFDQYFMIKLPSSKNIHLTLEGTSGLEMMVRHGDLPTRSIYDHHSDNGELTVPSAYSGTWYVLVHGDDMADPGSYSLKFETIDLILEDVAPSRHVIGVPVDMILTGVGFVEPLQVIFVGSTGITYEVPLVDVNSPNLITAHVKGNLLPAGKYDVRVVRPDKGTAELKDALEILEEGEAKFEARIIPGEWTGYHEHSIVYVEYSNTGDIAMRAPLLYLTAISGPDDRRGCMLTHDVDQWKYGIWTAGMKAGTFPETPATLIPEGFQNELQIIASGEMPGILQSGETRRIPVYYVGWEPPYPSFGSDLEWQLYRINEDDDHVMEWDSVKEEMRPDNIKDEAWDVIWNNFKDIVGPTYGDFIHTLNENAFHLYMQGQRVEDVDEILSLSFQQAEGWIPYSSIYSRDDMDLDCPGLDLTFERYYPNTISRRYEEGDLGWGWVHNWQYSLEEEDDGTVKITDTTGKVRIFQPNIRSRNDYMSQPGDWGKLTESPEDGFKLEEKHGYTLVFDSDGNLDHMEDRNGNRITCEYTDGSLSKLVHSSGPYIEITYNEDGLIDHITDSLDRTSTYSYEEGYLTSVEYFDGYTERYYYDRTEGSPSEHALTGFTPLGDSRVYITYHSRGYLKSYYREGESEKYNFIYGRGLAKVTDLLGNMNRFFYDHEGRVTRVVNPLGDSYWIVYDSLGQIEKIMDPAGLSIEYDNYYGNLNGIKGRAGEEYQIKYDQELDMMDRIIDPTGSSIGYDRDDNGNVIEILYADGSSETGSYDDRGNLITVTNRRGNTTSVSYDSNGRITGKVYADGSEIVYTYDERGNLISMKDSTGLTNYTYNGNDFLKRIDYPGGQWLSFTYDNARRRSASIDHMGNRINYDYDHAGRLEGLTTSSGIDVVKYEYDQLGRLSRKTLENGVYTTYKYDEANRIIGLANLNPDETVISWFRYTYDDCGRKITTSIQEGNWYYSYDDRDQLVKAVFDPTYPGVPSQDLEYNYDIMGNRVRTVVNGVEESYQSNDMNQYTIVGNVTYTYDPDGNLIQEEGPNGTIRYTYNDDSRLIGVEKGGDSWEYTYDGLGNRASITENNATSYLVVDPIGMGDVVGVYDENGTMMSRYIYGSDLVSMETGTGESYFYNFDAMGNTQELTDSTGAIVNSYSYMPFGEIISDQETVSNPFQFVGEKGVMTDSTGLIHMRARQYSPQTGRFTSMDPIGISGCDLNLYRYVYNSPTNLADPEGLLAGAVVSNLWSLGNNYVPWGSMAEGATSGFLDQTDAQFFGSGVDIIMGVSTLLSVGSIATASIALLPAAPIVALVFTAVAVVVGVVSIVKGLSSIFECFEPANTMTPLDPNHKECTSGIGPGNHVAEGSQLSYTVEFENMEEATAPAQMVTVIDPLSEDLDWSTFEFTEIGFGDIAIPLEPGTGYVDEVMEYSYKDDEYDMEIELHISGDIDTRTGEVFVMIYSIDPITQLPPEVNIGFLPPEDGTGRGQGSFSYNINPKPDLPSGTEIRNIATIQFNLGMEIDTNQIDPLDKSKGTSPDLEALVTIDAESPSSSVNALTEYVDETFDVSWSGQDDEGGSGIADYDIYMRENDGPWTLWLEDTNLTSAEFNGTVNNSYGFYSMATDNVGYREEKDPLSETITSVRIFTSPTANAGPDQRVDEGTMVTFDGNASTDDVGIVNYTWTFNDGTGDITLYDVGPSHLFTIPGDYTITLNVTNSATYWDSDSMELTVDPVKDDPDEESKSNYLLFVLGVILLVVIILGISFVVILIKSRKGSLDEE